MQVTRRKLDHSDLGRGPGSDAMPVGRASEIRWSANAVSIALGERDSLRFAMLESCQVALRINGQEVARIQPDSGLKVTVRTPLPSQVWVDPRVRLPMELLSAEPRSEPVSPKSEPAAPTQLPKSPGEALALLIQLLRGLTTQALPSHLEAVATGLPTAAGVRSGAALDSVQSNGVPAAGSNPLREYAVGVENRVRERATSISLEDRQWAARFNADSKNREFTLEHNRKIREDMSRTQQEMLKVSTDPKISEGDRAKKLDKLQKKQASLQESIGTWPMDMQAIKTRIYQILDDPGLSQQEKKDRIRALGKAYNFRQISGRNGMIGMEDFFKDKFVNPIKDVVGDGKKELERVRKDLHAELDARVSLVVDRYGKESVEAEQARASAELIMTRIDDSLNPSIERLGEKRSVLKSLYPSFWSSFFGFFKKAVSFLAPLLNCIPVVGTALYAGYQVGQLAYNAAKGNLMGALTSAAGALPGIGQAIGGGVGAAFATGGKLLSAGSAIGSAAASGDVTRLLGAAGSVVTIPGVDGKIGAPLQDTLRYASTGARVVGGLARGDIAGALGEVAEVAASQVDRLPELRPWADAARDGVTFARGVMSGEYGQALGVLGNEVESRFGGAPEWRAVAGRLQDGARFIEHMVSGRYGKALGDLSGAWKSLSTLPAVGELERSLSGVARWIESPAEAVPFLRSVHDGALSEQVRTVRGAIDRFRETSRFDAIAEMAGHGERFLDALAKGDIGRAYAAISAGVRAQGLGSGLDRWIQSGERFLKAIGADGGTSGIFRLEVPAVLRDIGLDPATSFSDWCRWLATGSIARSVRLLPRVLGDSMEAHDLDDALEELQTAVVSNTSQCDGDLTAVAAWAATGLRRELERSPVAGLGRPLSV